MRRALHDLASLAARLGVGGIFFANGWHKLEAGLTATGDQFATLGAPAPGAWAATTMLTELVGGVMLVAGLAVPACGLLLFAEAVAVFVVASGERGLPLTGGDVNLIVALGAASILLAVGGAGRLSVDHLVVIKRREAEAAQDFAAENEANDVIAALREPETSTPETSEPGGAEPGPSKSGGSGSGTSKSGGSGPGTSEGPETGVDTAEFPAVRPRPRDGAADVPRGAPERGGTSGPGAESDILVAGQKDETTGR
ncbi:DoxX family protein [Streptosporangium carneum]|uniref:DoxX family protein n=1 Tax=Streptosporangium carneum TaxID=47481 RepID=A0A9W6I5H0_9ACTN|nr:DoxX family protein [Streptosporangium carneum]GLK12067.1 hypothetical protein GCM10017600_54750 [Streptosporangium carneum]